MFVSISVLFTHKITSGSPYYNVGASRTEIIIHDKYVVHHAEHSFMFQWSYGTLNPMTVFIWQENILTGDLWSQTWSYCHNFYCVLCPDIIHIWICGRSILFPQWWWTHFLFELLAECSIKKWWYDHLKQYEVYISVWQWDVFGLITTVLLQLELPNLMLRRWSLSVLTYMKFKPRSTWIVVESTQKNYGHDCDHVLCMCAGKHWIKSMLLTATLFPFTCFGIGFALNTVAIFYHSLAAIPFGTMVSLPSHAPCIEDFLILSVGWRALPLHHSFNTILQTVELFNWSIAGAISSYSLWS